MKKKNLKTLKLNKTVISNLKKSQLKGGSMGSIECPSYHPTVCDGNGGGMTSAAQMGCVFYCPGTLPV